MTGDASRRTSAITVSNTLAPSLTTLLHRLEAATSRLEDIATSVNTFDTPTGEPVATVNGVPAPSSHAHSPPVPVQTPSAVTSRSIPSPASTPAAPAEDLPTEIEEFDKLINGELAKFIESSGKLDSLLGEQVSLLGGLYNPDADEL
jgi:adenylyl cyclase-associated protein